MRTAPLLLALAAPALVLAADAAPREPPATWATPIVDTRLENCFRVSSELLRSVSAANAPAAARSWR